MPEVLNDEITSSTAQRLASRGANSATDETTVFRIRHEVFVA